MLSLHEYEYACNVHADDPVRMMVDQREDAAFGAE